MKLMKLAELKGHDVYEFSYLNNYNEDSSDGHWSSESIYISDEEFTILSEFIDAVIENFNYYGPNKINIEQWNNVRSRFNSLNVKDNDIKKFFLNIEYWLKSDLNKSDYFWILGL